MLSIWETENVNSDIFFRKSKRRGDEEFKDPRKDVKVDNLKNNS